jgi:hypothetical protein
MTTSMTVDRGRDSNDRLLLTLDLLETVFRSLLFDVVEFGTLFSVLEFLDAVGDVSLESLPCVRWSRWICSSSVMFSCPAEAPSILWLGS